MNDRQRKAIVEEVDSMFVENDATVVMLGVEEDQYQYADAIVGTTLTPRPAVVYLRSLVIISLMRMNDWDYEDAVEWYEFNTVRSLAYIPDDMNPPILVDDL